MDIAVIAADLLLNTKNRDVTCNVNLNFSIEQHICSCNSSIRCVLLTSYQLYFFLDF